MMKNEVSTEQDEFIKNAVGYWQCIENGNSKSANLAEKRNKKIIMHLGNFATALLEPLLSHPSDAVRFAAAAHLMKTEVSDEAAKVLQDLAQNPLGLMALSAKAILDIHGHTC
ncbi:hypothetical protein GJ698_00785 [Pseudoduganella sp. FT26W]|uniref:HEAT repeat domain-containing protein n=1 Tax=Duganella aquatilis TaxID=2666082 RepID=A0A844D3A6_9BURK|nr:HEAT repeat domain-containing protein [Duganella aquatilis]MRW82626.1 hypothetical protein [Duganella aquatilis]